MSTRLAQIASHLRQETVESPLTQNQTSSIGKLGVKDADDVVLVAAVRTPLTKANKGLLKDTTEEEMMGHVIKSVCERVGLEKKLVEDICIGNCNFKGLQNSGRMSMLYNGFPNTTSFTTINRFCSSGLQAVANIASAIKAGSIDIGIGGGVESMTLHRGTESEFKQYMVDAGQEIADCLLPMGITSENVAKQFGVTRDRQDEFAYKSYMKAIKAQKEGLFNEEIVPMKTKVKDAKGVEREVVVTADDGARPDTTLEGLKKLRPAFIKDGASTAGNSSQVTDGAGAVLLMRRSVAEKLKMPIMGKMISFAVAGVPPSVMGIGPAYAIPKALQKAGITKDDVDIYEINEAFASQAIYSIDKLGIDYDKVNPKGGAIAIGHPLAATGARQVSTLFTELKRTGKRIGCISMCIGSGMGAAGIFERE